MLYHPNPAVDRLLIRKAQVDQRISDELKPINAGCNEIAGAQAVASEFEGSCGAAHANATLRGISNGCSDQLSREDLALVERRRPGERQ